MPHLGPNMLRLDSHKRKADNGLCIVGQLWQGIARDRFSTALSRCKALS
jgi:hypothetical protein